MQGWSDDNKSIGSTNSDFLWKIGLIKCVESLWELSYPSHRLIITLGIEDLELILAWTRDCKVVIELGELRCEDKSTVLSITRLVFDWFDELSRFVVEDVQLVSRSVCSDENLSVFVVDAVSGNLSTNEAVCRTIDNPPFSKGTLAICCLHLQTQFFSRRSQMLIF